jgi:hypothetical protein
MIILKIHMASIGGQPGINIGCGLFTGEVAR